MQLKFLYSPGPEWERVSDGCCNGYKFWELSRNLYLYQEECQRKCNFDSTCKGYSYLAETGNYQCALYDDCNYISQSIECIGFQSFRKPIGMIIFLHNDLNVIYDDYLIYI